MLLAVALLSAIKNNRRAFAATNALVIAGLFLSGFSTLLFTTHTISPFWWMLLTGTGLFLAYIPFQVVMFERMIALFRIKANAGFFVYICDSIGYLGSVLLLLYKNFFMKEMSWSNLLTRFCYAQTTISVALMVVAIVFFFKKDKTLITKPQVSSI